MRTLEVSYVKPALLDDLVTVSAEVTRLGRAQVTPAQEVRRADELLRRASVNLACVGRDDFRPNPLPAPVHAAFSAYASRPLSVEEA